MNQQLLDIADKFGTSEPVFKIYIEDDGSRLEFYLKNTYKPDVTNSDDPVEHVVANHYRENYNYNTRSFHKEVHLDAARAIMFTSVYNFFLAFSKFKNPKQSNLGRWLAVEYNSHYQIDGVHDGIIALYRYIKNNRLELKTKDDPSVQNVMAILEMMRQKYEK